MDGPLFTPRFMNERSYPTPYANSPFLPLLLLTLAIQKHSPDVKSTFKEEYDYVIGKL